MVSVNGMPALFTRGALKFLSALKKNNKREWFQPRKEEFEELLHTPLVQFAGLVNAMLLKAAPEYAVLEPAKALNRIYRDVRFSANKAPYQTHVSMLFPNRQLGKKVGAALYFHLSSTEAMVAAGMYFGETRELQAVREHLAEKHDEFRAILNARTLKQKFGELEGESLQKAPKQFGPDHPAADLLKRKQWLLHSTMPADSVLDANFAADAVKSFQLLIPFVTFLNAPLKTLPAALPPSY
jgi:uncharacterized protein (TIGR02453 family)